MRSRPGRAARRPSAAPRRRCAPRARASRGGRERSPGPGLPGAFVLGAASSFRRSASRSALRRALTKMIVELCSRTSASSSGYIAGQIEFSVGSVPPASGSSSAPGVSPGAPSTRPAPGSCRSSCLRTPASTIRHSRPGPTMKRRDLLERVLGRAQPDPLHGGSTGGRDRSPARPASREPLERQRQVRAALGRGDRVDLIDDAPARVLEQLLRLAGQHQVQRLGRRDQDVRRVAQHLLALALRRVAGAHRDAELGADPAQRHPQVAVDVVGERLQRRDVDEADPRSRLVRSRRSARKPVDRPQERRQRLARAGRSAESARARRRRSPARPAPGPRSGARTRARTTSRVAGLKSLSAETGLCSDTSAEASGSSGNPAPGMVMSVSGTPGRAGKPI